jgi:hypothetical protein
MPTQLTTRSSSISPVLFSDLVATILDGANDSDGIDLGGSSLLSIDIPAGFDGTGMTFKVSSDGVNYKEYRRMIDGTLVTAVVGADASYASGYHDFGGYRWIRLVATTAQTGDISITLKTRAL